jgi:GT2 family glycosyltransferase
MPPIAVAIVNYNTRQDLGACLASLKLDPPSELVVVDNASTDDSVEMVRADYPWVILHANKRNLGYGSAANQAVTACHAQYVLLLNSDTILQHGALEALIHYLDENPRVAIVGPRILNLGGTLQPSCFPFPTPVDAFLDVSNLSRLVHYVPILRESYLRTWSHTQARQVPWVCGAALAIRRSAFEVVGGFDASFFMYFEEVDLCYRLACAGWEIHFAPVADVIHTGGKSTQQQRVDMTVQFFVSLAQFYRRHYSKIRMAELFILVECIALARLMRDVVALRLACDNHKRLSLAENVSAWRRLLLGHWRKQVLLNKSVT